MVVGSTPKQIRSHSESSWMPNRFSCSVLVVRVRAMRPSKASQKPETARQNTADSGCPEQAKNMPKTPDAKLA